MKTIKEMLFTILGEECAEVVQGLSKCERFGMNHINPLTRQSNFKGLQQEVIDVLTLIKMTGVLDSMTEEDINRAMEAKKNRTWNMMRTSAYLGTVESSF